MPANFDDAFERVKQLAADFKANENFYLSPAYQEAEARRDFIDKFLLALGWDVNHDTQKNPYEQEVKVERKEHGVSQRRADYAFYLAPNFRDVKFYIEAKKPFGDIATPDNYFQTIRYGWNSQTPIAALFDFEQFEIVDCRFKPDLETALQRNLKKFHFSQYADKEKFAEIYYLFSREAVANGSLEKYAESLPKKRGAVQRGLLKGGYQSIDEAFLEELDAHRETLARIFKNNNPQLDGESLTEATQRTLDRLVFIRFLEDKLIEPQYLVAKFGERGSAWGDFIATSRRLDGIYNGIVFKKNDILDAPTFKVDDDQFGGVCEDLCHINSPYDFNAIPIHILGSIYERFPGYIPGFLQPIQNRILMISTGIRAQVGIKVLGDNLDAIQKKAFEIERVIRTIPGAVGLAASRMQGKPYLNIEINQAHLAHHGMRAQDILDVVETGIGGMNVSTVIDGRERIPIQVRLQRDERDDIERLGDILIPMGMGKSIPLGQVATISRDVGADEIDSENGQLRVFVQANVESRDLGGFVKEAQTRIAKEIQLPPGMTIEWSGQYEDQIRAQKTLEIIVPTALFIIFLLLYIVYHSLKEAAHVILAVPFALTGGVFLQWFLGYNFSVAVWVGYIALFGTAIQTGVVMVVYLQEAVAKKRAELVDKISQNDLLQAVKDGARLRLRPIVMTVATIVASLLPILWSNRAGTEVMKPLAAPIIGGMISSLACILIITPVIFAWLRERELNSETKR